jgi:predicted O-methyltransferase YrrM
MAHEIWTQVDHYITGLLGGNDPVLEAALRDSDAAGLPSIHVSAAQGKLLLLLAQSLNARYILEIGTLAGYSTIWLARALPADGRLLTLEYEPKHAAIARANLARAGLSTQVEVRVGPALTELQRLAAGPRDPFDLIFIDADKPGYPDYFTWALKLARRGTVIIADNVVRGGAVIDANSSNPGVPGVRRMNELVAAEPRVSATIIQTVGAKGYDGFLLASVLADT